MKKLLLLLLMAAMFNRMYACLNDEALLSEFESPLYRDREGNIPYGHIISTTSNLENNLRHVEKLYQKTKDIDFLSDKGLILILLGKYEDAIELYLNIEKLEPRRYSTASNIGTVYELAGQNNEALRWIKKAVKINPDSHHSSEWIHVKILEAKIKGESFYTTNFLLNTDFGNSDLPESSFTNEELSDLHHQLFYQLNERVSFVKQKEKIVAQLLFDLGNIAFLLGNYKDALADYNRAVEYGFTNTLILNRVKETRQFVDLSKTDAAAMLAKKRSPDYALFGWSAFIVVALAGAFFYIRKRRRNFTLS